MLYFLIYNVNLINSFISYILSWLTRKRDFFISSFLFFDELFVPLAISCLLLFYLPRTKDQTKKFLTFMDHKKRYTYTDYTKLNQTDNLYRFGFQCGSEIYNVCSSLITSSTIFWKSEIDLVQLWAYRGVSFEFYWIKCGQKCKGED